MAAVASAFALEARCRIEARRPIRGEAAWGVAAPVTLPLEPEALVTLLGVLAAVDALVRLLRKDSRV